MVNRALRSIGKGSPNSILLRRRSQSASSETDQQTTVFLT
jgi:hypothetical protein